MACGTVVGADDDEDDGVAVAGDGCADAMASGGCRPARFGCWTMCATLDCRRCRDRMRSPTVWPQLPMPPPLSIVDTFVADATRPTSVSKGIRRRHCPLIDSLWPLPQVEPVRRRPSCRHRCRRSCCCCRWLTRTAHRPPDVCASHRSCCRWNCDSNRRRLSRCCRSNDNWCTDRPARSSGEWPRGCLGLEIGWSGICVGMIAN